MMLYYQTLWTNKCCQTRRPQVSTGTGLHGTHESADDRYLDYYTLTHFVTTNKTVKTVP